MSSAISTAPTTAAAALALGRDQLLAQQHPDGFWRGELETNVTMDAEDLLLREFLGARDPAKLASAARWIRSRQREDGTWSNFYGGPANLSTTVEAYVALRLAGDPPEAAHMRAAADFVRDAGGVERARVFTHIWLALFGLWPWELVPALPPELVLLPRWVPLNPYDFACWARQTIVALTVVWAHRPVRSLALSIDELRTGVVVRPSAGSAAGRMLLGLDRALHAYERRPVSAVRRAALARAERWIVRRQEADGSWGGIQPPWVYSLIALHLQGYSLEHPVMRRGLEGIEGFIVEEEGTRRLEACQSPVWDTALSVVALRDAGTPADDPALVRAADWLLEEQVFAPGDWSLARPRLAPGGWAFEFANDNYPDVDDTAEVALALSRVSHPEPDRVRDAIARATEWTLGMQSSSGGWGAFDADNTRALCRALPFCDFGEVIDPPSADVTAHALELLAQQDRADETASRRGLEWLSAEQEPDGSWFGRWGVNYVYGTGAALPALVAVGVSPEDLRVRRAVRWLEEHQAPDGGWGEDPRSYDDPGRWAGRGPSTASQTAWALIGLHAAGRAASPAAGRGVRWLVETQQPDGSWDEPEFTGTGFPGDYYINYHLYRQMFPVMALGRCLQEQR
ncbi:MAG TPA: squalene--hopene cyclase [Solirubrobacteraceae bacterium]|nr:squalene--hopene cyclase [Solirubrobacteraceae bacterium]